MPLHAAVPGRALAPGETFIKICGITRPEDGLAAVEAGANAIGFVFAPSPRQIDVVRAAAIRRSLPAGVGAIGVFVDAGVEEVLAAAAEVRLDGIQLQGDQGEAEVATIRRRRPDLFVTRALRLTGPGDAARAGRLLGASSVDAVMVDSKDAHHPANRHGQVPVSWLEGFSPERLIVAGGLGPETVAAVVTTLRPWGVDVSSGVEEAPGRKDPALIGRFVRAVREAELVSGGAGAR